jgi:hypothetical protein
MTWNDSCTNAEWSIVTGITNAESNCNNPQIFAAVVATGGSGGKSSCTTGSGQDIVSCTGGYPKPSWQTGTGVPNDGKRDIPDISLFASNGFNGNFYVICSKNVTNSYCDPADPNGTVVGIGGTSASTPAFAGIMALIDQKTNSRQGNPNYILYSLAAKQPASGCNSSSSPASTCVFYDVTSGTIAMPCLTGSTSDCHTNVKSDQFGVLTGYATTAAYDLATGLGTVNATNLVNSWATATSGSKGSTTTLSMTPSPLTITHGATANLNVTVAPAASGTGTPTGEVALETSTGIGAGSFLLTNGAAVGSTVDLPGGSYTVTAHYPGDATFAASDSAPVSVKVTPEASKATIAYELFDPNTGNLTNPNATTATFGGSPSLLRINVTSQAGDACVGNAQGATGCPTGTLTLTDNTKPLDGGTFALNSNGYAEDPLIDLPGGVHNLKVTYPGDNSYAALTPFTDVITISPVPTTLALASDAQTVTSGSTVNLTATLTAQNIFSNHGPTGTLTFLSGNVTIGTSTVSGPVNASTHQVTVGVEAASGLIPVGTSSFTAKYTGDSSYSASISQAVAIKGLYSTVTSVSSSNLNIQAGQNVTFTAKIAPGQTGGPALTGTVQFLADQTNLGSPVPLVNGQAQFTTSSLAYGNVGIIAFYSGDTNYAQSEQGLAEVVTPIASATAITSSSSSIQQGQNETFTATVSPSPAGGPIPTGIVMFLVNGAGTGGGNVTLNASGQAVLSSTTLPVGSVTVTGNYLGDFAHSPSSGTATVTVTAAPDFSVVASPASITVASPGQTGSTSLMLTAMNGLSGTFNLVPQCLSLPSESTCAVSPASVTFSSTMTTATVMLTVSTRAPSSAPASRRFQPTNNRPGTILAIGLLALLSLLVLRRGRGTQIAFSVVTLAALLTFAACGGGSGGGGGGVHDPGTPVGLDSAASVSFTIGTATHAVPISINVQ